MKKINLSEAGKNRQRGTFVCTKEFAWVGSGNIHLPTGDHLCADKV